jgi:hypothetical protein
MLEVAQSLDQLLPHPLLRFTSNQYKRMDFFNGRNTTDSALGGGASFYIEPLAQEACLNQHRVLHPLQGRRWWVAQKKVAFNYSGTCKVRCVTPQPPQAWQLLLLIAP